MSKIGKIIIIVTIFALGLWIGLVAYHNIFTRTYPLVTVVSDINTETDTVTCVDFSGNGWEFTGIEDWEVGDYCALELYDKNTAEIDDDIIIKTRYCGWLEGAFGITKDYEPIIES